MLRRIQIINDTKIKYLSVANTKIYKVTDIDFCNLTIEATETNLSIEDIPESEVFLIEELREFRIRLHNSGDGGRMGEVIDFSEWIRNIGG